MTFKTLLKKNIVIETLVSLRRILPRKFKKQAFFVIVLLLFNSILELAGLGALIPLFISILQENAFEKGLLQKFYSASGANSETSFTIGLSIAILFFIIIKNVLSIMIIRYQAKFSFSLYQFFATRMQRFFYQKGFLFFKSNNHNVIIRDINQVPFLFAQNLLLSLLSFLTEAAILMLIVISIIIYDPKVILLLSVIVVPVFLTFYQSVKKKITDLAIESNDIQAETGKNLYQSIFGYVDVMINNNKEWFFSKFRENVKRLSEIRTTQYVYNLLPGKVIETSMILGILVIISYGLFFLTSRDDLLILLGVFALAAYRILPSINRMMMALMNVKSYQFTIKVVEESSKLKAESVLDEEILFENEIEFDHLSYSYPGKNEKVITDLNLSIKKGERIGFIGRSGSGKTTLVNLLMGFLKPSEGRILIDGQELNSSKLNSWRQWIGYVQQDVFLIDGTLAENIALGYGEIDKAKVLEVAERASLTELINDLEKGIDTRVGERGSKISGGQKQRVGIARALYSGAKILFFDEATSALDSETEKEITEAIHHLAGKDLTMIIIAHRHSTLKYCDRIIELKKGEFKAIEAKV